MSESRYNIDTEIYDGASRGRRRHCMKKASEDVSRCHTTRRSRPSLGKPQRLPSPINEEGRGSPEWACSSAAADDRDAAIAAMCVQPPHALSTRWVFHPTQESARFVKLDIGFACGAVNFSCRKPRRDTQRLTVAAYAESCWRSVLIVSGAKHCLFRHPASVYASVVLLLVLLGLP
jgi:hypothetical protein